MIAKHRTHADQAREHLRRIQESGLAGACSKNCSFGGTCLNSFSKNQMICCNESSYGVVMFADPESAEFKDRTRGQGDMHNMEDHGMNGRYCCSKKKKETTSVWRSLIAGSPPHTHTLREAAANDELGVRSFPLMSRLGF
jgi:hypothetical protein